MSSKFKAALHLPHEPTEQEKSDAVRANADREEKDHQERIRKVRAVEDEPTSDGKEEKVKEALFGEEGLKEQSGHPDSDSWKPERVDGTGGKGEECVKRIVSDVEDDQRVRDQKPVQINGVA